MKTNLSIGQINRAFLHFIARYHVLIFTLTVIVSVSIAIFFLNGLLDLSSESQPAVYSAPQFDTATIDRINKFNTVNDTQVDDFQLPSGRINPFAE